MLELIVGFVYSLGSAIVAANAGSDPSSLDAIPLMVKPPSTVSVIPVIAAASSEASHRMGYATSIEQLAVNKRGVGSKAGCSTVLEWLVATISGAPAGPRGGKSASSAAEVAPRSVTTGPGAFDVAMTSSKQRTPA